MGFWLYVILVVLNIAVDHVDHKYIFSCVRNSYLTNHTKALKWHPLIGTVNKPNQYIWDTVWGEKVVLTFDNIEFEARIKK